MNIDKEVEALVAEYGTKGNSGTKCAAGTSPHRTLIEALHARGVVAERIATILREKKQFQIGGSSVRRHLAEQCKCLTQS